MRPITYCNNINPGGCSVYYGNFGFAQQIGQTFGSGNELTSSVNDRFMDNRVVRYRDSLFCLHDGAVWKYNEVSNQWSIDLQIPEYARALSAQYTTGLYLFNDGIEQKLTFFYCAGAGLSPRQYIYNGAWTICNRNSNSVISSSPSRARELFYNNKIISYSEWNNTGSNANIFDCITGNVSELNSNTTYFNHIYSSAIGIFRKRFWEIGPLGDFQSIYLLNNMGSYMVPTASWLQGAVQDARIWTWNQFFHDGENLYLHFPSTNFGNMLYKFTMSSENLIQTTGNISSIVKPALFPTTSLMSLRPTWDCFGGQNKLLLAAHENISTDDFGLMKWFRWNGPDTQMTYLGASVPNHSSMPGNYINGGERTYIPGQINIQLENWLPGREQWTCKLQYRIYESASIPSGTLAHVWFLRPTGLNEIPSVRCSLKNTSIGSISNGNTVINAVVGSGTLHEVEWDGWADGVAMHSFHYLIPFVSGVQNV